MPRHERVSQRVLMELKKYCKLHRHTTERAEAVNPTEHPADMQVLRQTVQSVSRRVHAIAVRYGIFRVPPRPAEPLTVSGTVTYLDDVIAWCDGHLISPVRRPGSSHLKRGQAIDSEESLIPLERIEQKILFLRGEKVMLSPDLAMLYGVEPRALVQAVKRNLNRFPADFMFQLTKEEVANLKSQIVISSWGGARRATPYAFTENGVAMLSSVLNSARAIRVNVEIMRTFTRLRKLLSSHAELARKLDALEKKYDAQFRIVFDAIRELMAPPPERKKGRIGFAAIQTENK
jgi:hypothetical protein